MRVPSSFGNVLRRRLPFAVLLLVTGLVTVAITSWRRGPQASATSWQPLLDLRRTPMPSLPLAGTKALNLADGAHAHLIYLVAADCAPCEVQKNRLAALLEALPKGGVITVAIDSTVPIDYWTSADSNRMAPVRVDAQWLRSSRVNRTPLLIFVGKRGTISAAIAGSVLSWSRQTMINEFRRAEIIE
jgi:hypothetical protein